MVGPTGTVIATDLLEMQHVPGVTFVQGDFMENSVRKELRWERSCSPVGGEEFSASLCRDGGRIDGDHSSIPA